MNVLRKDPGKKPEWVDIENTLESLQEAVDGYIEAVTFSRYIVICDEEGRLKGKEANCNINGEDFVGSILIVGDDGDDFTDLPNDVSIAWR